MEASPAFISQLSKEPIFIGMDIGGTLAKLCISMPKKLQQHLKFQHLEALKIEVSQETDIYFIKFSTDGISELVNFIKKFDLHQTWHKFYITGGGAYKFCDFFQKEWNVEIVKINEFESLAKGLDYLNQYKSEAAFMFSKKKGKTFCQTMQKDGYPFLLVNIGSGVSILKFSENNQFERVTGTCVGGGTFLGLCNLITGVNDFEELLSLSNEGDDKKIDLFVKDIYGESEAPYSDLDSSSLAISLGKLKEGAIDYNKADIILSLLHMIAFNIGQVSYLLAKLHKIDRVYFAGNFIRNHEETMDSINYAFEFFSNKDEEKKIAVFLTHDGYLGALGSLLLSEAERKENPNKE